MAKRDLREVNAEGIVLVNSVSADVDDSSWRDLSGFVKLSGRKFVGLCRVSQPSQDPRDLQGYDRRGCPVADAFPHRASRSAVYEREAERGRERAARKAGFYYPRK